MSDQQTFEIEPPYFLLAMLCVKQQGTYHSRPGAGACSSFPVLLRFPDSFAVRYLLQNMNYVKITLINVCTRPLQAYGLILFSCVLADIRC